MDTVSNVRHIEMAILLLNYHSSGGALSSYLSKHMNTNSLQYNQKDS